MPPVLRFVCAVLLFATVGAGSASACSIILDAHRTSWVQRLIDWRPPEPALTPTAEVRRGIGPRPTDEPDVTYSTSCDDIGFITLTFPADADTAVGYDFEIVAGQPPENFRLPGPLRLLSRADGTHGLTLSWIDGATDRQEPFAFVLGIRTVDAAGNRSRTVTKIIVCDPGREATD